jgi:hypothetical protein
MRLACEITCYFRLFSLVLVSVLRTSINVLSKSKSKNYDTWIANLTKLFLSVHISHTFQNGFRTYTHTCVCGCVCRIFVWCARLQVKKRRTLKYWFLKKSFNRRSLSGCRMDQKWTNQTRILYPQGNRYWISSLMRYQIFWNFHNPFMKPTQ